MAFFNRIRVKGGKGGLCLSRLLYMASNLMTKERIEEMRCDCETSRGCPQWPKDYIQECLEEIERLMAENASLKEAVAIKDLALSR